MDYSLKDEKGMNCMKLTDVQIKLAEQLLLTVINRESIVEYNELANRISPPIFHRQVGREIGEVSKLCNELGLPLLSAKVISKGSGKAGVGFYNLMSELGIDTKGKSEKELFSQELKSIRECKEWYRLADYLNLDLDLPRPDKNNDDVNLELKDSPSIKAANQTWIIPSNTAIYDVISAFEKLSEVDWRQNAKYKIGDMIYIYCAKPLQRIMFQTEVVAINIPFKDIINDKEFWVNAEEKELASSRTYVRLKLMQTADTDKLSLKHLLENGLKTAPQGPQRVSKQFEDYVQSVFEQVSLFTNNVLEQTFLPEELASNQAETLIEGAKKTIIVNAYERNPTARRKCIQIHGSRCAICNFDFGEVYGKDFEGKIHVHHIKPLCGIDEAYEVDPEHDLIPVCPNCHMIIHSKKEDVFSIEEVKQMIESNIEN